MIYVGTSGYGYHNWSPTFYPPWLIHDDYLDFYSERFNCCELTFTRYRIPTVDGSGAFAASFGGEGRVRRQGAS